ncbi:putative arabinose 5-phosphate isomerase [Hibiscus syriacus]|uniref:Arabinose 5-phosphate isomerase n=1 Tax=Hibiscus syriacus TaxID=106335 RepID=A0A6A2ZJW7_HIBSY|nr:putative arabinose 5-phosphate isomerase [Hibiscus syriacus]
MDDFYWNWGKKWWPLVGGVGGYLGLANISSPTQNLDLSQALSFTQTLLNSRGTIFFSGVGKSGFVPNNISQTLVSLGIRSSFLSPLEALHGDIGAISSADVLVLFSKSGSTEELLHLVPCLCPFDLAPVTSTAIQIVFGDTVAIALMGARNLTKEQYAAYHPAGRIGKSLIFKVKDVMNKQHELPICKEGYLIMDQLVEMTSKGCGFLLVIDDEYHLLGTFTDGDLRRTLNASGEAIFKLTVGEMCNREPRTISPEAMAVEAMQKMESPPSPVQFLPVIGHQNILIGIVTYHGLVSAGL